MKQELESKNLFSSKNFFKKGCICDDLLDMYEFLPSMIHKIVKKRNEMMSLLINKHKRFFHDMRIQGAKVPFHQ